ncbi:MAG: hypothetical protein PHH26_08385 [Candidatus Thermoplasmatota archaeon]|nr:hypothetical protein [Candidatus Thermoplasmatota archaeon]
MYNHLITWKHRHITDKPGYYAGHAYDAVLPDELKGQLPHLYKPIRQRFLDHQRMFHFKTHKFAGHMASSQVACANLFLPIMAQPTAAPTILQTVKPDLESIATDQLDSGFRVEFWDEIRNGIPDQKGLLGDHNRSTGTDADFAIAYRNHQGELNLWLIEHKFTEQEFTTCGGAKSKGRQAGKHSCDSIADILSNTDLCYYHSVCRYEYWNIITKYPTEFPRSNLMRTRGCPFIGGLNQLWRNQLLAIAIENSNVWPYKRVFFSVVHHPKNHALQESMDAFTQLIGNKDRFFSFTPEPLIEQAKQAEESALQEWADWYSDLYLF